MGCTWRSIYLFSFEQTIEMIFLKLRGELKGDSEQFNGREGETATLLFGSSVSLTLRVGGFAPTSTQSFDGFLGL